MCCPAEWLAVTYTSRFNNRHFRSGHLFQGQFKSIIVENDSYLLRLSCYIHRNPLRAGIVGRLAEYFWSSYKAYAYGNKNPDWLLTDPILAQFDSENRHGAYRKMAREYAGEEKRLWEDFHHGMRLLRRFGVLVRRLGNEENPLEQQRIIPNS